jgi:hypothetical protein
VEDTVHFSGVIVSVQGDFLPSLFQVGDRVTGSYTFDLESEDTDPAPNTGQYSDALLSLSITVERDGAVIFHGTWGEGTISTDDNDTDPDAPGIVQDQVSMASNVPLDVTSVEGDRPDLVFLQIAQRVFAPAEPDLLLSDAIPTDVSRYNTAELRLGSAGLSGNQFGPGFRTTIVFTP